MQSRRSSFIDNFDLDPVWILEIDGIVVRRVVRICFGTTIQNFNLSWLQEVIDERINRVCGANTKSNVTQAGTLAVKFRLLVSTLCHLNAEIGMPVSGIKVVAIGVDLEIQKGQQVFPENKGFVFGREVNSDMPSVDFIRSRYHHWPAHRSEIAQHHRCASPPAQEAWLSTGKILDASHL